MVKFARRKPNAWKRKMKRRTGAKRVKKSAPKQGAMFVARKYPCIQFGSTGTVGQITTGDNCSALTLDLGAPVQSCFGSDIYDVPFGLRFNLSSVQDYTEFTQLFDAYKILSAKVKLQSTLTTGTQVSTPVPYVEYIQDHDSGVAPNLTIFRQKMGTRTKYFSSNRPAIGMGVRPKVNPVVYGSAGGTAVGYGQKSYWLDCQNPDIDHFGIVGVIRNVYLPNGPSQQSLFTMDITQHMLFKDVQ